MTGIDPDWTARWLLRRATAADVSAITAMQQSAYAQNRVLLGAEPLPLQADYADIVARMDTFVAEPDARIAGVLILDTQVDTLHLWNLSVAPAAQGSGLGNRLLAAAEDRARCLGVSAITLVTGERLRNNVDWYRRHGYVVTQIEALPDRRLVHFRKHV